MCSCSVLKTNRALPAAQNLTGCSTKLPPPQSRTRSSARATSAAEAGAAAAERLGAWRRTGYELQSPNVTFESRAAGYTT